jgi:disulfide bond formation protein DsbB
MNQKGAAMVPATERDQPMGKEEKRRLWELTLHEDLLFSERHGLFLIAESMLTVAYVEAAKAGKTSIALAISAIAMILTVVWVYVSGRHTKLTSILRDEAERVFPEYANLKSMREELVHKIWSFQSQTAIGFVMPILLLVLWAVLVVLAVAEQT